MPITPTSALESELHKMETASRPERLGYLLRSCYGGVANNPTKAMVFLVADQTKRDANQLMQGVSSTCFGETSLAKLRNAGIVKPSRAAIDSYFQESIIPITPFASTSLSATERPKYSKTFEGLLIGDVMAYKAIEMSSDPSVRTSNYITLGKANTIGITDAPTTTVLVLSKLVEEIGIREISLAELVDDLFDYRGKHDGSEFKSLVGRLSFAVMKHLRTSGLIEFQSEDRGAWISYSIAEEKDTMDPVVLAELSKRYAKETIRNYKRYANRAVKTVRQTGSCTSQEVGRSLGFEEFTSMRTATSVLSMLRQVGIVRIVHGKENERKSSIKLLPSGRQFYTEHIKPMLELSYFFELAKDGIKYALMNQVAFQDLGELIELRQKWIDPLATETEALEVFRAKCAEARKRHQRESGHIPNVDADGAAQI